MKKIEFKDKTTGTTMLSCRLRTDLLERLRADAAANYRSVASELAKILDEYYGKIKIEGEP